MIKLKKKYIYNIIKMNKIKIYINYMFNLLNFKIFNKFIYSK